MNQWKSFIQPPRQGTSHKIQGNSPCQDKAAVKENSEVIVAVLSDGLGQLNYSGIAAEAIVEAVSTYLVDYNYKQLKEEQLKQDILSECKRAMNKCSRDLNISLSKMDCTLLFVILFKKGSKFIFGQLGDGAICVIKQNQALQASVFEDRFKASSNLTKTVLSSDAYDYFNLRVCPTLSVVGFFLTTDGLENELYSKAGKVKQKIEWYFNLISNNDRMFCINKIETRWDELSSEDKYGFTDDMSLVAIFQPNLSISLPEDAEWLCICGHRNRLESSRCESCGKDFLKVYKGVNFKQSGGNKLSFFSNLNKNPEEEQRVLRNNCVYPLESDLETNDDFQKKTSPNSKKLPEQFNQKTNIVRQGKKITSENLSKNKNIDDQKLNCNRENQVPPTKDQQRSSENPQKNHLGKLMKGGKSSSKDKKSRIFQIIIFFLVPFLLGILVHAIFNIPVKNELASLQRENQSLQDRNVMLIDNIVGLNKKIIELVRIGKVQLPDGSNFYVYENGDIYLGQLLDGIPNGTGVLYSTDLLMTGNFRNGLKNGEFYLLYNDGHSEIIKFDEDKINLMTQ